MTADLLGFIMLVVAYVVIREAVHRRRKRTN